MALLDSFGVGHLDLNRNSECIPLGLPQGMFNRLPDVTNAAECQKRPSGLAVLFENRILPDD